MMPKTFILWGRKCYYWMLLGEFMPDCTLCGKRVTDLNKVELEGTIIEVCDDCCRYGTVVELRADSKTDDTKSKNNVTTNRQKAEPSYASMEPEQEDVELVLVEDYGKRVKQARERMGLDREKFALKLKERESVIRRIERQEMEPDESLVKKLERELDITLTEEFE